MAAVAAAGRASRRVLRTVLLFAGIFFAAFVFWTVLSGDEAGALEVTDAPAGETPADPTALETPIDTLPEATEPPPAETEPVAPVDPVVPPPAESDATTPAPPADGSAEPVAPTDTTPARPAPPATETPRPAVSGGQALPAALLEPQEAAPDGVVTTAPRVDDESTRTHHAVATVHRAASASATTMAAATPAQPTSTPPAQPPGAPSMPLTPGAPAAGSGGGDISQNSRSVGSNVLLAAFFIAAGVILTMSWRVVITERLLRLPFVFSTVARPG